MGHIAGFICSSCNYKREFFLGVGTQNQKELKLYKCSGCKNLTSSRREKPKCRRCGIGDLVELSNLDGLFNCPKCNSKNLKYEIGGLWD